MSIADLAAQGPPARTKNLDRTVLDAAKILTWDIETVPAKVELETYDLKLRNPYIHHANVVEPGKMLAWTAKWYHEPHRVMYRDLRHPDMLQDLWSLLDAASYSVTFNGDRFDLRKVRGYFARAGMPPFRQPKSIDLIKTVRTMGWESSSLDYSCRMFGVRRKIDNGGAGHWRKALQGDETAWRELRRYAVGDVRATEDLFDAVRPWITNHPIMGYPGDDLTRCPRCVSPDVNECGAIQAQVIRYRQFRCNSCLGLFRTTMHSRSGVVRAL
jgi:hypothetical protein